MLYVGIDQHAKQITVVVRNSEGEDVLRRQASTRPEKIAAFFVQLAAMDDQFMAILETCGFNDRLIEELRNRNCMEIVLIHPERPSKKKTDRRDARKLCDLLWLIRERLAGGQPVRGLRRIYVVTPDEQADRQLTDGVGIDATHDPPIVLRVLNS
jgi:transposase